jgi:hypothetical protein
MLDAVREGLKERGIELEEWISGAKTACWKRDER